MDNKIKIKNQTQTKRPLTKVVWKRTYSDCCFSLKVPASCTWMLWVHCLLSANLLVKSKAARRAGKHVCSRHVSLPFLLPWPIFSHLIFKFSLFLCSAHHNSSTFLIILPGNSLEPSAWTSFLCLLYCYVMSTYAMLCRSLTAVVFFPSSARCKLSHLESCLAVSQHWEFYSFSDHCPVSFTATENRTTGCVRFEASHENRFVIIFSKCCITWYYSCYWAGSSSLCL